MASIRQMSRQLLRGSAGEYHGDGETSGFPMGASQGSMSGLSYAQSWTIGSGGGVGELYLSKLEKQILGYSNKIGSYSPVQGCTGVPVL